MIKQRIYVLTDKAYKEGMKKYEELKEEEMKKYEELEKLIKDPNLIWKEISYPDDKQKNAINCLIKQGYLIPLS